MTRVRLQEGRTDKGGDWVHGRILRERPVFPELPAPQSRPTSISRSSLSTKSLCVDAFLRGPRDQPCCQLCAGTGACLGLGLQCRSSCSYAFRLMLSFQLEIGRVPHLPHWGLWVRGMGYAQLPMVRYHPLGPLQIRQTAWEGEL